MFDAMSEGFFSSPGPRLARALGILAGAAALGWAAPAAAKTTYFPHQDARFLYRFQRNGGAVVVPEGARASQTEALPLVVFLHGTNPTSELHMWLGGTGRDLRPLVKRLIDSGGSSRSCSQHRAKPRTRASRPRSGKASI
jgi:hypothetical protein